MNKPTQAHIEAAREFAHNLAAYAACAPDTLGDQIAQLLADSVEKATAPLMQELDAIEEDGAYYDTIIMQLEAKLADSEAKNGWDFDMEKAKEIPEFESYLIVKDDNLAAVINRDGDLGRGAYTEFGGFRIYGGDAFQLITLPEVK